MDSLKDRYDWIVLGDHPGALLSACLASQMGFSVLALPLAPSLLARVAQSGQCVDPESNFLLGLGRVEGWSGLLSDALAKVGVLTSGLKLVRTGDEVLPQVMTPDMRVHYRLDDKYLEYEIDREMGEGKAKDLGIVSAIDFAKQHVLNYWRSFPEKYLEQPATAVMTEGEQKTVERLRNYIGKQSYQARGKSRDWLTPSAENIPNEIQAKELLEGLWSGVTLSDQMSNRNVDLIHALVLARTAASFRGGMSAYRRFLLTVAKRLGAHVAPETECRRVFVENKKLIGVQVSHRGKLVGASAGILGCSISHANDYLYFSGRGRRVHLRKAPQPKGWRFTLALTVNEEAVPPGMGHRSIWKEEGAPALEVELASPQEYNLAGKNQRLIFVRTWMPFNQQSLDVGYQRKIAARMFRQLKQLLPFLEYHVVKIYPDFRESLDAEREEFSETYGFVTPELIPENLRLYEGDGVGAYSGIEGLYVSSGESFPRLGTFGPTVAAIEAVMSFAKTRSSPEESQKNLSSFWGVDH